MGNSETAAAADEDDVDDPMDAWQSVLLKEVMVALKVVVICHVAEVERNEAMTH